MAENEKKRQICGQKNLHPTSSPQTTSEHLSVDLETLEINTWTKLEKSRLHLKSSTTYCNFSSISGMSTKLKMI
jgi:hypothetical protein